METSYQELLMKCRYCQVTLSPLRSLTDGEFCCDEHRAAFAHERSSQGPTPVQAVVPLQAPMAERMLRLPLMAQPADPSEQAASGFKEGPPLVHTPRLPQADWEAVVQEM